MEKQNVYQRNGFNNRHDYLVSLSLDYGSIVFQLADLLGPSEDFDGLITELEDYSDGSEPENN